jgi:hypothetical protein
VLLALAATPGLAQHEHHEPAFPPFASGTSWLPAAAPLRGFHSTVLGWLVMLHGSVFAQYVRESGPRGNYQFGSVNWFMGEAERVLAGGTVRIRAMASAEVLTVTDAGYPQLLQVAQPYKGGTLPDRMHPHEMVSEAALMYDRNVGAGLRASLYLAAVGEPALGPVAYLHRPSAANDPTAPLGHHAQDVSHESFGVVTMGVFSRRVHLEASLFNGAHPDEVRTDFDYEGARLNATAVRITVNPNDEWSIAASGSYLPATEGAHAHGALRRYGLAILQSESRRSVALIWGANVPSDTRRVLHTALLETNLELTPTSALFGRLEYVTRTDEELGLVGSVPSEVKIGALAVGYARRVFAWRGVGVWAGIRANAEALPEELELFYGTRTPTGFIAYLQLRPPLITER